MGLGKKHKEFKKLVEWSASFCGKDPCDLTWNEMQQAVASNYKNKYDLPNMVRELGGFTKAKDALFGVKVSAESVIVSKMAKDNNKQAKEEAEAEYTLKTLGEQIEKTFKGVSVKLDKMPPKSKFLNRELNLGLSDLHFGSDLDPKVGTRKYSIKEEARSLAKVVQETCEYKRQHRQNTILNVIVNGDIIQGKLHDVQTADAISLQVCRAIHLLTQAIARFASEFPKVRVFFSTGNHDRITERHKERATADKFDSLSSIIYFAVKTALAKVSNIEFTLPYTPWVEYQTFGKHIYCTHGDTNIKIPNPNGTIKVNSIEADINKLNARLNGKKYSVVFCGHVHSGMLLHLTNGVVLITNPPLMPTDQFGLSLNIDPDAPTGQWLWEAVGGHVVGDSRFVRVTEEDRQDASLEKIIKPFGGLDG